MMYPTEDLILLAASGFLASVLHSVTGFGGALLLAIMLAPVVGIKDAVPITAAAMILANVSRVYLFRKEIPWKTVALIVPVSVPGIVLGAMLFVTLSESLVALLLGCYLILAVIFRHVGKRRYRVGKGVLASASVVYGLVGGVTFGAGLMLAPFLLGAGLVGVQLIATVAVSGLALNIVKSTVFGLSDTFGPALLIVGVMVGIFTIPGAYVGRWMVGRLSAGTHTLLLECFLLFVGIYLLKSGLQPAL